MDTYIFWMGFTSFNNLPNEKKEARFWKINYCVGTSHFLLLFFFHYYCHSNQSKTLIILHRPWFLETWFGFRHISGCSFTNKANIDNISLQKSPQYWLSLFLQVINPLSANPTKWSITLKQFVGLSVFHHLVRLAL